MLTSLGSGMGGGQYSSSATATSGTRDTLGATFGDFNVGASGGGLNVSTGAIVAIVAAAALALYFVFRK